jgi:hypothetical protein
MTSQTIELEDAIARVVAAARKPTETPLTITLPIRLSPQAELWVCAPECRYDASRASLALGISRKGLYALVAKGALPRVRLNGKLSFRASELRTFITANER